MEIFSRLLQSVNGWDYPKVNIPYMYLFFKFNMYKVFPYTRLFISFIPD